MSAKKCIFLIFSLFQYFIIQIIIMKIFMNNYLEFMLLFILHVFLLLRKSVKKRKKYLHQVYVTSRIHELFTSDQLFRTFSERQMKNWSWNCQNMCKTSLNSPIKPDTLINLHHVDYRRTPTYYQTANGKQNQWKYQPFDSAISTFTWYTHRVHTQRQRRRWFFFKIAL